MRRILDSSHADLRRDAAYAATGHMTARGMLDIFVHHAQNDHDIAVGGSCIRALGSAVSDSHAVRDQVVDGLPAVIGTRAATRAKSALLGIARDQSQPEECRCDAVAALGYLSREPEVAREIDQLFAQRSESALCAALEAARRCDGPWEHEIVSCLTHESAAVRRLAAVAANVCWVESGGEALRHLCSDRDLETAAEALMAYSRIGDIADVTDIVRILRSRRDEEIAPALEQAAEYLEMRDRAAGAPLTYDEGDEDDDDIPF